MFNLEEYIKNIENKITIKRNRKSKVEESVINLVKELISKNEPTTIKTISERLGKKTQYIHQVVRKSNILKKIKIKGRTLIILK